MTVCWGERRANNNNLGLNCAYVWGALLMYPRKTKGSRVLEHILASSLACHNRDGAIYYSWRKIKKKNTRMNECMNE